METQKLKTYKKKTHVPIIKVIQNLIHIIECDIADARNDNCCIPQLWVALEQCSTIHDNALTMDFMITLATTKSDYYLGPSETWDNIFKNGPSDICGRHPLENFKF